VTSYIHELTGGPGLRWDVSRTAQQLAAVRCRRWQLIGRMEAMGFGLRREVVLARQTENVLKSSEIEGEIPEGQREVLARLRGIRKMAIMVLYS
jgi:hypothetical protein